MGFEIEGMLTARPFNGPGWSVERQRCGGCSMRQPHRRWHVLSFYPERGIDISRASRWAEASEMAQAGALGLYPAGEAETVKWRGDMVRALHLHLSPALFAAFSLAQTGKARPGAPYLFTFVHKRLAALCDALYSLAVFQPSAATEAQTVVDEIVRIMGAEFAQDAAPRQRRIGRLGSAELLDNMHGEPATTAAVDRLAQSSGLGRSRFYQAFRNVTGATPHDYLVRSRLEYAKQHLQSGEIGIAEIAVASGFTDQSHFTNTFKKRLGLTPLHFLDWFAK